MARSIHVYVRDDQYRFLRAESSWTGLSMAQLVRAALDDVYGDEVGRVDGDFAPWLVAGRPLEREVPPPLAAATEGDGGATSGARPRAGGTETNPDTAAPPRRRSAPLRNVAARACAALLCAARAWLRALGNRRTDAPHDDPVEPVDASPAAVPRAVVVEDPAPPAPAAEGTLREVA
jgi:hypothetical protein